MKKLLILSLLLGIFSCEIDEYKDFKTEKIALRQLVNTTEQESHRHSGLFFASYTSEENDYIKMFANVNGLYQFLEVRMENIRIKIDNKVDKPYIYFKYNEVTEQSLEETVSGYYEVCVIVCPEKYLPEKLLPIELKN